MTEAQAAGRRVLGATFTIRSRLRPPLGLFTSTGVVYGVADAAVTDLPVVGVSA